MHYQAILYRLLQHYPEEKTILSIAVSGILNELNYTLKGNTLLPILAELQSHPELVNASINV